MLVFGYPISSVGFVVSQLTAAFSRLDVAAYSKPLFDADGDQKQLRCLIRLEFNL